jgi:hypothetical protein
MIKLIKLSKIKNKNFTNETFCRDFIDKLTKKANQFNYAIFYKISNNRKNIKYNLIEKTTYTL